MGLIGALAQVQSVVVIKADSNFIYFHGNDLTRLKVYTGSISNGRFLNGADLFYGNETGGVLSLGFW